MIVVDFKNFYDIMQEKCGSFVEDNFTRAQLYGFYQQFGGPILNEHKAMCLAEGWISDDK